MRRWRLACATRRGRGTHFDRRIAVSLIKVDDMTGTSLALRLAELSCGKRAREEPEGTEEGRGPPGPGLDFSAAAGSGPGPGPGGPYHHGIAARGALSLRLAVGF
jgi:hypothetical protein